MTRRLSLLGLSLLAACGSSDSDPSDPPRPAPTQPTQPTTPTTGGDDGFIAPTFEGNSGINVIAQGWDDDQRTLFWHQAQGSYVVPYSWALALTDEKGQRFTERLVTDMGYLESWFDPTFNPDVLPIGFAIETPSDVDKTVFGIKEDWLGMTCAACHVGAIDLEDGTRVVLDGGPALADLEEFNLVLSKDLHGTLDDATKDEEGRTRFDRFAREVFDKKEDDADPTAEEKQALRGEVADFLTKFDGYLDQNFHDKNGERLNGGIGRTDAFGVIINQVAANALGIQDNARTPDAPVSYPFIWGSPDLDWVQYNGLSQNPFTRNIGEVLGVYGLIDLDPNSDTYLATSVKFDGLRDIEMTLRELQPPRWEQVFGFRPRTPEQQASFDRGKELYAKHCEGCHRTTPTFQTSLLGGKFEKVEFVDREKTGTDMTFFLSLVGWSQADMGPFADTTVAAFMAPEITQTFQAGVMAFVAKLPDALQAKAREALAKAQATKINPVDSGVKLLAMTTSSLAMKYAVENNIPFASPKWLEMTNRAGISSTPFLGGTWKARNLTGIFATAPYLHNGSVRTIRDLLKPAKEREETFKVGSYRYDEKNLGYVSEGQDFDTKLPGNSNAGHDTPEFGVFEGITEDDRDDLIEYIKTL